MGFLFTGFVGFWYYPSDKLCRMADHVNSTRARNFRLMRQLGQDYNE